MNYQALFLDIDGTILRPDHTYSEHTKIAIEQVKKQGIEVFLCTGRPIIEIDDLADELGVESLIGYNGAYAKYKGKTILNEPMPENDVDTFLSVAKSENHELILYTKDKNHFTTFEDDFVQTFKEIFQLRKNELFDKSLNDQILGITALNVHPNEASHYIINDNIRPSQVNVNGVVSAFDIIRINMNKGEAIKRVLHELNIPTENSIAFGDGMNDKEMLQTVGVGFAMGNADSELVQYADYQTKSSEEDGIFYGLKQLGVVKE
ncbi:HAD family hydrolase [Oceanobacillus kimchii]|uniref:HAD family hydrolase n=1 Tax=Oceanobacillus kimchii TaxID=746691 RepID=UPI00232B7D78|nr:HAD family hydrolase [Oceanobacillus kimchii]